MSWHVEPDVLHRYQTGVIDRVVAASVEAHVTECVECRGSLILDERWLEQSWAGIADRVEPGRAGVVERILTSVGLKPHLARVIALSPAFRVSFVLAVILVMGFAVGASASDPNGWAFRVFLFLAPLLPVTGIALAYGNLVDAAHELTLSSPIDSFRLLMLRAITVLIVSVGIGLVAWPFVEAPTAFGPSAWLAPAVALTLTTLALASRFEAWVAGAMVAGGWATAMALALSWDLETFNASAQWVYGLAAVVAGLVMAVRRNSYDREGGSR
jgi:hypothetical protein